MPDRLAFLRRPASLSSRVTGLVGIAMVVVFLIFNWISVRSLERHFAEMDEEELGVISSSVIRALGEGGLKSQVQHFS
jgi:two-component system heavy metal sensor histidine kinase CusS